MKKTVFIKNSAILTASALVLRLAGIIFKIWIAKLIGSEGVGLYQLIFSFYMLAATFATSGISTAVTRLVSEEQALGNKSGIFKSGSSRISVCESGRRYRLGRIKKSKIILLPCKNIRKMDSN